MSNLVIITLSYLASIKKIRASFQKGMKQETLFLICLIWIFHSAGQRGGVGKGDGGERRQSKKKGKKEKEEKVLFHFYMEQLLGSFWTDIAILEAYILTYNSFLALIQYFYYCGSE